MCTVRVKLYLGRQFTRVNSRIDEYKKQVNVVVAVLVVAFAVYLGWLESIALSFAFLSIIVATFFASRSLKRTSESLELTRKMIRPFLTLSDVIPVDKVRDNVTLTFKIHNSGSLPASDAHTDIDFFGEGEEVTEDNLSTKYQRPKRMYEYSLVFPNHHYYEVYILNLKDTNDLDLWENIRNGKVKFRLRIMYTGLGNEYITIQTEHITKPEWEDKLQLLPVLPQKWE